MKPLDIYDDMPPMMRRYISNYGWNFSKRACESAVRTMRKEVNGREEPITPWSKEEVDALLAKYGVKLKNDKLYNATYVANMCQADYLKSSVPDEQRLVLFIKDTLDDCDGCDELPFRYWVQKMIALGTPIEWNDIM